MFLDVGNGHKLFYEIVGSPEGKPIVVLHGGPGAPTSAYRDSLLSIFDLRKWRILLWDQRGCGRSKASKDPRAHNTTWDLVADMERLRSISATRSHVVLWARGSLDAFDRPQPL